MLGAVPWSKGEDSTSRVRIILVGSLGGDLHGPAEVTITSGGHFVNALMVKNSVSLTLPFGDYLIDCKAGSLIPSRRSVRVSTPATDIVVGLALKDPGQVIGEGQPFQWSISGKVRSGGSDRIIVKLVGVFLSTSIEKEILPGGTFDISVDEQGKYLLLLTRGSNLVFRKEVQVEIGGPMRIELGLLPEVVK
jgi:hypothetical protein